MDSTNYNQQQQKRQQPDSPSMTDDINRIGLNSPVQGTQDDLSNLLQAEGLPSLTDMNGTGLAGARDAPTAGARDAPTAGARDAPTAGARDDLSNTLHADGIPSLADMNRPNTSPVEQRATSLPNISTPSAFVGDDANAYRDLTDRMGKEAATSIMRDRIKDRQTGVAATDSDNSATISSPEGQNKSSNEEYYNRLTERALRIEDAAWPGYQSPRRSATDPDGPGFNVDRRDPEQTVITDMRDGTVPFQVNNFEDGDTVTLDLHKTGKRTDNEVNNVNREGKPGSNEESGDGEKQGGQYRVSNTMTGDSRLPSESQKEKIELPSDSVQINTGRYYRSETELQVANLIDYSDTISKSIEGFGEGVSSELMKPIQGIAGLFKTYLEAYSRTGSDLNAKIEVVKTLAEGLVESGKDLYDQTRYFLQDPSRLREALDQTAEDPKGGAKIIGEATVVAGETIAPAAKGIFRTPKAVDIPTPEAPKAVDIPQPSSPKPVDVPTSTPKPEVPSTKTGADIDWNRYNSDPKYAKQVDSEYDIPSGRTKGTFEPSSADILTYNLEKSGMTRPIGHEAHHIVPVKGGGTLGESSRDLLKNAGIDINDVDNGIYLPKTSLDPKTIPDAPIRHQPIHTERYYQEIFERLERVRNDPVATSDELRKIRSQLSEGTFPY